VGPDFVDDGGKEKSEATTGSTNYDITIGTAAEKD